MAAAFSYDHLHWNQFEFRPSVPESTSVRWEFGDGSFSHERTPRHTYASFGTYEVRLILEDDAASVTTSSIHVPLFTKENPVVLGVIGTLAVLLILLVGFAIFLRRLKSSTWTPT